MLHLHRAERADRLADALGALLATPQPDPFSPEIVAVPTRGMERWLTQTLSARLGTRAGREDGVCANIAFPFPGRLIGGALARASDIDPDSDPWVAERLVWPLYEVVDAALGEPWLAPLAAHLAAAQDRRFARVRELATLFDAYAVRRPELIIGWAGGAGEGWQPELWRRLRERIGVPSSAERLAPACERLRDEPALLDLPDRIALFGLTRLLPGYVRALHALGVRREVHLLILHPSPAQWQRIATATAGRPPIQRRAQDPTERLVANRLLASWGRDSRELQLVLAAAEGPVDEHHLRLADRGRPATLLGTLQAAIRADRAPPGPPLPGAGDARLELDPDDASVRVHACHGRRRQVEVLREAILHRLAADPTLEPRDVIVMCPDVETFAPLIQATFGSEQDGPHDAQLRVRLADRSLRQTNPVLAVVARLLELANSRLTASEVLDLADTEPVRRRFRLDDDALARIRDWIVDGAIHWGLDTDHRRAFKLGDVEAGTWEAGLRRLLVGVALSESDGRLYRGVLPIDDVDSGAIELAGRFAELIHRLGEALRSLRGPHTVAGWAAALTATADVLTAVSERDAWQRLELARLLADLVSESAHRADSTELALPEARALVAHRLGGRPTRASFRTGHLTVCTLHPMRSVPHRVVCLLGLDDGAFPRRTPRNGDDLLLADPHVGDRDPRAEDRQLLLDALLAARDGVIVTYTGRDERTNAPRPPAVPVGELLDAIDATSRCPGGEPARERVVIHHPLQPFDPRNFLPDLPFGKGPWSFDRIALEGARALRIGHRNDRPSGGAVLLRAPLPPLDEGGTLALQDLIAFVERPVRAFLRQRLGISLTSYDDEVRDELPIALDALERWGIGQRLLETLAAGAEPRDAIRAEIARGTLPPGMLGHPVVTQVRDEVAPLLREARRYCGAAAPASLQTNVTLLDGTRLTGTVGGVRGTVLFAVSYSRLNPRHRLAAWVRLLALSASHPAVAFEAVTVARPRPNDGTVAVAVARIPALASDSDGRRAIALAELARLAALRASGLREPLPLPCRTGAAFAAARILGRADERAAAASAADEWTSSFDVEREDREAEHLLAFGGRLTLAELLAFAPAEGECGEGWEESEGTRLGRLARRLWAPLLAREVVDER